MKGKSLFIIAIALMGCLLLGGTSVIGAQEENIVIGSSIITYEHPFYIDVVAGMQRVADEAGVELLVDDPAARLEPQVSALETYIIRGVDALIVYGVDPVGVVPVVEEATAQGIPVITADMELETDQVVTFIGSDNMQIGREIGEWTREYIEKNMGGEARIGVAYWAVSIAQTQRAEGFIEEVTKLPGVEIVTQQNVEEALRENAMAVTENILTAHPDLDIISGSNQTITMGAVSAVEALGADVKVVGVDIDTEMVQAIEMGNLLATVAQQPLELGATSVETALKVLAGEEVPERITIPVLLVSQENLDEAMQTLEILDY